QGLSAKEICEKLEKRAERVQASFVVNTMEYLHKGGRCSGIAAFAASALKIKPALLVENGAISVYKKYMSRTGSRAIRKYLEDIFEQFNTPDKTRIFITHTAIDQEVVNSVREALKEKGFENILETVAGSTITSHCGPGTLGVLYINDGE
ncbi:MAG: DegV family EDD domain-containing protein, partial [Clostridia bacterium]|nr:DegV family EDD domain-containing protein [Clostridia bacterium]